MAKVIKMMAMPMSSEGEMDQQRAADGQAIIIQMLLLLVTQLLPVL